jgi:hypothetical protein
VPNPSQVLMGIYVLFVVVLMMNLLIAVLATAHSELAERLPSEVHGG